MKDFIEDIFNNQKETEPEVCTEEINLKKCAECEFLERPIIEEPCCSCSAIRNSYD